jgi:hypothetical protein
MKARWSHAFIYGHFTQVGQLTTKQLRSVPIFPEAIRGKGSELASREK